MCQCRIIDCNKCTHLVGMLITREAIHEWGQRVHGKSVCLLLNYTVNLKQLSKNKAQVVETVQTYKWDIKKGDLILGLSWES